MTYGRQTEIVSGALLLSRSMPKCIIVFVEIQNMHEPSLARIYFNFLVSCKVVDEKQKEIYHDHLGKCLHKDCKRYQIVQLTCKSFRGA